MRSIGLLLMMALAGVAVVTATEPQANFLMITVTSPEPVAIRAIWRPYAGAVSTTGREQQDALVARRSITTPDSIRRWRDPASRDTVLVRTPINFVVDMNPGAVVIEAVTGDTIRVEAQLTPSRGPKVHRWGRSLLLSSDGVTPDVRRSR